MSIQYPRGKKGGRKEEGGERKMGRVKAARYEVKVEEGRAAEDQRELRTWRDSNAWTGMDSPVCSALMIS